MDILTKGQFTVQQWTTFTRFKIYWHKFEPIVSVCSLRTGRMPLLSLSMKSHMSFLRSQPREIESKILNQTRKSLTDLTETTSRDRKHLDSGSSKTSNLALLSLDNQRLWPKFTRTCLQAFASLSDCVLVEQLIEAECVLSAHEILLATQGHLFSVQHNIFFTKRHVLAS